MATQKGNDIPLTLVAEEAQQHFRLLELPPELVTILTSKPPEVLELKGSDVQGDTSAGNAVLCTKNSTFDLRQKNSSNTVYLLRSNQQSLDSPFLEAIAQCNSSLELIEQESSSAKILMQNLLPVYSSTGIISKEGCTKRELFDQIPSSENECEQAYTELATFVHPDTEHILRPSAAVIKDTWLDLRNHGLELDVDLANPLSKDDLSRITMHDRLIDSRLGEAVLKATANLENGFLSLDAEKCTIWLGTNLLEASPTATLTSTLSEQWKDMLPERWRSLVDVSKLANAKLVDNGKSIRPTSIVVENTNKRRWHERFRPNKR